MRQFLGNFHRKDYLMLHYLAGATIQVANLANYNCHPQEGDNNHHQEGGNKFMWCHNNIETF